jgi:predicted deacetylase
MSALIYAVFAGVPGYAKLCWHGTGAAEAQRAAIANAQTELFVSLREPFISLRVLPPEWQWEKTVFGWECLPGLPVPITGPPDALLCAPHREIVAKWSREYTPEQLRELQEQAMKAWAIAPAIRQISANVEARMIAAGSRTGKVVAP